MEEIAQDNLDIPQDNPDIQETIIPDATDSYDELAKDAAPFRQVEQPKRGRGRPKGAKNRPKPSESEEEELPPKRKTKSISPLDVDVEFDEGYGGAGRPQKPVRIKPPPAAAKTLLDVVAEAAQQHGMRERDRRRNFYESFLPM